MSFSRTLLMILIAAACTLATRAIPFLVFGGNKEIPHWVRYLGMALPPAVIALLVVYCVKGVNWLAFPNGIPELISIAVVAVLHLWKRNNLLSIGAGTVLYMVLVQAVFI
ncbi:branched-chain amino acid transporter permease [Agathobaculum sp.]|uniref:branched-chain amino acid transporter permease n=1 Tax=Agathobaculum sp. TaxID=2048138 RepID=UPI002A81E29D|nr:branched-chain amino acid transporter permease [Agathobaculum sp.]MDY3618816.1 branched-chain amino acid transporter permease [Agathobaculum sp.]